MKKVSISDLVFATCMGALIVIVASMYVALFIQDIKTGFAAVGVTTVGLIVSLMVGLIIFEIFDLYEVQDEYD